LEICKQIDGLQTKIKTGQRFYRCPIFSKKGLNGFFWGGALLLLICRKSIEAEYDRQITNKYN